MQCTHLTINRSILTFGSNLNEAAVRKAARPSFRTTANPPTRGEYSISMTYILDSRIGTAANCKTRIKKQYKLHSKVKFIVECHGPVNESCFKFRSQDEIQNEPRICMTLPEPLLPYHI
jgi:hypothetical protein